MLYVIALAAIAILYCVLTDNLIYVLIGISVLIALVVDLVVCKHYPDADV